MAIDRPLTTSEAAAGLGVSRSTVKNWIKEFSLGAMRDARGDWRIDPDALPVFEEVKRLRDEGLGLESIRRVIGAPTAPREPVARPGLVTRFPASAPTPYDEPPQACEVLSEEPAGLPAMQAMGAAIESQERLAMQMARLAHANGQLQAQVKYVGAELARLQQQLEQALAENARLRDRLAELETHKQGTEFELMDATERLEALNERIAELEGELVTARAKIEELSKAKPRSGMHFHFAGPTEEQANQQLMDLQKELIKAKERIAAFEAAEYARDAKRPWWNFWDD